MLKSFTHWIFFKHFYLLKENLIDPLPFLKAKSVNLIIYFLLGVSRFKLTTFSSKNCSCVSDLSAISSSPLNFKIFLTYWVFVQWKVERNISDNSDQMNSENPRRNSKYNLVFSFVGDFKIAIIQTLDNNNKEDN